MKSLPLDALSEALDIPLWGSPPPFPFESLSDALAQLFDKKTFAIKPKKSDFLPSDALLDGIGDDPTLQHISLSPLPGTLTLAFPKESERRLYLALALKEKEEKGLLDEDLQKGFVHFLTLITLDSFNRLAPFGNLTATLTAPESLPEEGAFSVDIELKLNAETFWFRLVTPKEFRAAFKTHFTMEEPPLLSDPKFAKTPVPLTIEVGNTTLKAQDLKKATVGDFILLDRCTYDLEHGRGMARLTLGSTPLFDIRLKGEEIKILEKAFTQENTPMLDQDDDLSPLPEEDNPLEEAPVENAPTEEPLSKAKDLPITLVVEVERLQMPLSKLSALQPGNVLNLAVQPENGVYLTTGGKRVAKGELVQVGEGVGVKILALGD